MRKKILKVGNLNLCGLTRNKTEPGSHSGCTLKKHITCLAMSNSRLVAGKMNFENGNFYLYRTKKSKITIGEFSLCGNKTTYM